MGELYSLNPEQRRAMTETNRGSKKSRDRGIGMVFA
jgi:hypothetical protein